MLEHVAEAPRVGETALEGGRSRRAPAVDVPGIPQQPDHWRVEGQEVVDGEVPILEVRPDPGVEPQAGLGDPVHAEQAHGRTAREDVRLERAGSTTRLPRAVLPTPGVDVHDPADVLVEDERLAGHDLDLGVLRREPVGDAQELRVEHVVRVGERDPLAGRVVEPQVAGGPLAAVRLREHLDPEPGLPRPRQEHVQGAVGRAVVDRDDLDVARHRTRWPSIDSMNSGRYGSTL